MPTGFADAVPISIFGGNSRYFVDGAICTADEYARCWDIFPHVGEICLMP
jgi:hypothetical protein